MDAISAKGDRLTLTLGHYAHQILHKLYRRIVKFEVEVYRDTDPEPLHQMRVGMRRLRTALHVFQGVAHLPTGADDKAIRKFGKTLGTLRDLDVLSDRLRHDYRPALFPVEQRELDKSLKKLAKQRKTALKRVRKTLRGKHYKHFKRSFQAWLDAPIYGTVAGLSLRQGWPDVVQPITQRVLLHPAWMIDTEGSPEGDRVAKPETAGQVSHASALLLHDLRKCIKQQRYQMEFFIDLYDHPDQLEGWKTLQDCLGQLQDGAVIRDFLRKTLGRHWDKLVPNLVQRLTVDEQAARQEWRSLQPHYLDWQVRQSLRQVSKERSGYQLSGALNGMPDGVPDGVQNEVPGGVPDGVQNEVPGGVSNGVSNGVPDGISNGVSDGASEPEHLQAPSDESSTLHPSSL